MNIVIIFIVLLVWMPCHAQGLTVRIDKSKVHSIVNRKFVNVAADLHTDIWNNLRIKTLASGLAPSFLRLGGFDADHLIFQNDKLQPKLLRKWENNKKIERERKRKGEVDYCNKQFDTFVMTTSFFDEIHRFVSRVGWDPIFDLNLLLRKPDGVWDPSNAQELINYTVQSGYRIGGWELGNESNDYINKIGCQVAPRQLVKDFRTLNNMLKEYPQLDGFEVLGPSVTQLSTDDYFERFLDAGGGEVVTAATFHQYYEDGTKAKLEDFYDPNVLNILYRQIRKGVNLTRATGTKVKLWLGETGSAWTGGAPGISDRYVAAFMWLDKLGMSARDGIDAVIRQSFLGGGNYSLLDKETFTPNPDYWLTLLFKLLVGNKVLRVTSPDSRGKFRAYAHCTQTTKSGYPEGSVTVYAMNLDQSPVVIKLPEFSRKSQLHVYSMLPENNDLSSKYVLLNGEKLQMIDDKTLPNLLRPVKTTDVVFIPALSYSFIVIPDANLNMCM